MIKRKVVKKVLVTKVTKVAVQNRDCVNAGEVERVNHETVATVQRIK